LGLSPLCRFATRHDETFSLALFTRLCNNPLTNVSSGVHSPRLSPLGPSQLSHSILGNVPLAKVLWRIDSLANYPSLPQAPLLSPPPPEYDSVPPIAPCPPSGRRTETIISSDYFPPSPKVLHRSIAPLLVSSAVEGALSSGSLHMNPTNDSL